MYEALDAAELLRWEIRQRVESGHDLSGLDTAALVAGLPAGAQLDDPPVEAAFAALAASPRDPGLPADEPEGLAAIEAGWAEIDARPAALDDRYAGQVLAAWTGRVAGNMLGKPVESGDLWTTEVLEAFLRAHDAWPLRDWFPAVVPAPPFPPYRDNWTETTAGRIDGSSRDDDVDYTILNLHVLSRHGSAFGTSDVATGWLELLPFLKTYTAERAAMRNLVQGRGIAAAATFRNPYREWIGAAIRGDVFGYVCPGDPAAAARLAYRDAVLSHTGNGVYGEMWVAALVAAAFTAATAREALDRSLAVVPPRSRLHVAVSEVRRRHDQGLTWRETRDRVEASVGRYGWVHTVNNAAVLAAGLLYGDGDFSATIGLTVSGGWDTDSTGATAGSVAGILAGPDRIPARWREPLRDRVRSAVFGYDRSTLTGLARQTVDLAHHMASGTAPGRDTAAGT